MKHTEKCSATVYPKDRYGSFHGHQCSRKAVNFEEGKGYCKQHTPSLIKAKSEAKSEEFKKEFAKKREREAFERKAIRHHEALVEALEFCKQGFATLPRSYGYDITHIGKIDTLLNKIREE